VPKGGYCPTLLRSRAALFFQHFNYLQDIFLFLVLHVAVIDVCRGFRPDFGFKPMKQKFG